MGSSISITNNKIQLKWGMYNPAIYIPKIGKVIYGMESWWKVINNKEELKDITDNDINNVWYVQALKILGDKDASKNRKK